MDPNVLREKLSGIFLPISTPFLENEEVDHEGLRDFDAASEEVHADHVFGVPLFFFRSEAFWGHDRMPLLEERLTEAGLSR